MGIYQHDQGSAANANTNFPVGVTTIPNLKTQGAQSLNVFVNVTNIGTGTLTVAINGIDPVTGIAVNLLTSVAISGNGMTRLKIGPNIAAVANTIAQDYLPETLQITATAATGAVVGSIGWSLTG